MPIPANALAVLAKAPIPGTVKTRLVPPLTLEQAAELAKALLIDQLEHLSGMRGAEPYLAFSPASAGAAMERLAPRGLHMFPQQGEDLGARMANCLEELWQRGHRNLVLIGGDLPPVPLVRFDRAFEFLAGERHRVILGPSRDGGYYFIGMNRATPEIFSGMTWSHDRVLAETMQRLEHLSIECSLLPEWLDIDSAVDLAALRAVSDPAVLGAMRQTRAFLEGLSPAI